MRRSGQQAECKSRVSIFIGASLALLALTGCEESPFAQGGSPNPSAAVFDYSRDDLADDFSSFSKSSASASFEKKKLIVHVTITCMNNAKDTSKNDLRLEAYAVRKENDQRIDDISALLYKIDDAEPQIYRDEISRFSFINGNINIKLGKIVSATGEILPEILKIRIIRNASPLEVQIGNIDDLAMLPKIDLEIPIRTSNVGKVISDCKLR